MSAGRPPRVASWLLRRFVPEDVFETVAGDLHEVYQTRIAERGGLHARGWYWLQAVSFSVRFQLERVKEFLVSIRRPSLLDFKLGTRMLLKSPLLTITGCVAIATAIGINAGMNEFMQDMFSVADRIEADERVVQLINNDIETGGLDPRVLEDVGRWRQGLETVEHVGAAIMLDMGLVLPDGHPVPVNVVEMSASGFGLTGMVPELGRPFVAEDDGGAAEPVMVLAYDAWQRFLAGDPEIVGQSLRMGETTYEVVGIAPDGFNFPRTQDLWVNFRRDPEAYPPRSGPPMIAFGQLAPERTLQEAQIEMEQLGLRTAADSPETHGRLRPTVRPFREAFGISSAQIRFGLTLAKLALVMLLVVACANIATLVFARNAQRESEIAVRSALGAGRGRIVTQLFVEAIMLAIPSAWVGLAVAERGIAWGMDIFWAVQRADPPYWFDPGMSPSTVGYSMLLAVLGAGVVGILPALRATRRDTQATLQRAASGSGSLAFGRLPTAVIVLQIAISVALIPIVLAGTIANFQERFVDVAFDSEDFLTARLLVDSEVELNSTIADQAAGESSRVISVAGVTDNFRIGPALLERYQEMWMNVGEALREEPGVRSLAFTSRLPGLVGQSIPATRLEIDRRPLENAGWWTRTATAGLELYDVVGNEVVEGRSFTLADYAPNQHVALVNRTFVNDIFEDRSPIGALVRDWRPEATNDRPWTEIVGVIDDEVAGPAATARQIYYPLSGLGEYPVRMLIDVAGDPADFAPRLRAVVAAAEPGVMLDEVYPLVELQRSETLSELFFVLILGFVALVTALLATAGVYALMSFIVAQRTREIGIRTALGADPRRVIRGVFQRTFIQLGVGVVLGLLIVGTIGTQIIGGWVDSSRTIWLASLGVSSVLIVVGLIGCAIPVARALRIQPTEALSAEG